MAFGVAKIAGTAAILTAVVAAAAAAASAAMPHEAPASPDEWQKLAILPAAQGSGT